MTPTPAVHAQAVHKHFGTIHVLRGVDLRVETGQVMVVVGPSFSLSVLNGLTAEASLPLLLLVREALGGNSEKPPTPYLSDYWAPTPGNALAAINRLVIFAQDHPSGVWQVV